MNLFYLKPVDRLSTMEWQYATGDYSRVLRCGISGIITEIEKSLAVHRESAEIEFLTRLWKIAHTVLAWTEKCSAAALKLSEAVEESEYKANLKRLSAALLNVPKNKPSSFYEAVLSIYVCFSLDPDSVGTLDRYLTSFYESDIASGAITRDEAKEYLQELFLMLQAKSHLSDNFTRGGESHFCIAAICQTVRTALTRFRS